MVTRAVTGYTGLILDLTGNGFQAHHCTATQARQASASRVPMPFAVSIRPGEMLRVLCLADSWPFHFHIARMSKLPKTEKLSIAGPAGRLEALVESPRDGEAAASAVICHPHPEHGGTMQNKVVHTLARAFVARGFAALRFNFRGVSESEGTFDGGEGEVQDALAAVRTMKERMGDAKLWLAGFSFGAAIAIHAAAAARPGGLVSVAPAVSRVSKQMCPQPDCPWLIIQGDEDEVVAVSDTIAWVNELEPGPELQIFEGTGHFFHGKLVKLRHAVEAFIDAH